MRKIFSVLSVTGMVLSALHALAGTPARATGVTLYKTPGCLCCEGYADYLRLNGFSVSITSTHELSAMSREAGVPDDFQGCHLAFIDGYAVSGHVPVNTVNRLLTERPDIKGVTLPDMPLGSPGMTGVKTEAFTIYEIGDGLPKVYAVE